jgi:hypothetical protein
MSRLSRPPRLLVALTSFCSGAALGSVVVILAAAQGDLPGVRPQVAPIVLHVAAPTAHELAHPGPCGEGD